MQNLKRRRSINANYSNSFAITEDGQLWGWGANRYGQLGTGTAFARQTSPVAIMPDVAAVSSGGSHSLAVTNAGRLYAWGANDRGQMGDGGTTSQYSPIFVMDNIPVWR